MARCKHELGKTVALACGGTGGHLVPGIALAERLQEHKINCLLIVREKSIDQQFIKKYAHLRFIVFPEKPLKWSFLGLIKCLWGLLLGFFRARKLFKTHSIACVIGFGGFTNIGIGLATASRKIPLFIHEANRIPGKATRLLAPFCKKIFLPNNIRLPKISPSKQFNCGFPVRKEMQKMSQQEARRKLYWPENEPILLVFGGSQGSGILTRWCTQNFPSIANLGLNLYCICGPKETAPAAQEITTSQGSKRAVFISFCEDMSTLMNAADLVLSRSGAGTLAECLHLQLPMILVPWPLSADNHQWANARFLDAQGAARIVSQDRMDADLLTSIQTLWNNKMLLDPQQLKTLDGSEAALQLLVEAIEKEL